MAILKKRLMATPVAASLNQPDRKYAGRITKCRGA